MDKGLLVSGNLACEVLVKNEYGSKWLALFEGKWRKVHIQLKRTYIVFYGQKINIQIEGV